MTQTEALKKIAYELYHYNPSADSHNGEHIHKVWSKEILKALAQPEQEPVATLDELEQEIYENTRQFVSHDVMEWMLKRYYTTPPQRKLTDEQIAQALKHYGDDIDPSHEFWRGIAKAIEAAHGIK